MEAVACCDDAIEPIHAVKSIRHRKHDDRQQEDQIEEDFASAAFRREGEPPMMAEPKHAGDDEADDQRDDRLCVGIHKVYPGRRVREPAGLRQIIGEQRHRNAEDGVAQCLQSAHFETTDLLQPRSLHPPDTRPRHAFSCCQRFWNDHQSTSVAIGLGSHVQSGGHKRTLSSVTPRPTLTLSARNGQSGSTGSNLRSWMQMRAEVKSKKMTPYQS